MNGCCACRAAALAVCAHCSLTSENIGDVPAVGVCGGGRDGDDEIRDETNGNNILDSPAAGLNRKSQAESALGTAKTGPQTRLVSQVYYYQTNPRRVGWVGKCNEP